MTTDRWAYDEVTKFTRDAARRVIRLNPEQEEMLSKFIAKHGPAVIAGRDPVEEALERARRCSAVLLKATDETEQVERSLAEARVEVERLRTLCAGPVMPEEPSEELIRAVFLANDLPIPSPKQMGEFIARAWTPIRAALAKEQQS